MEGLDEKGGKRYTKGIIKSGNVEMGEGEGEEEKLKRCKRWRWRHCIKKRKKEKIRCSLAVKEENKGNG